LSYFLENGYYGFERSGQLHSLLLELRNANISVTPSGFIILSQVHELIHHYVFRHYLNNAVISIKSKNLYFPSLYLGLGLRLKVAQICMVASGSGNLQNFHIWPFLITA
jgi:hypothetical protein